MNIPNAWLNNKFVAEFQSNPRLQWMTVVIAAILLVSLTKHFADLIESEKQQIQTSINLAEKYQRTASSSFDTEGVEKLKQTQTNWLDAIPSAFSASIAEASALSEVEQKVNKLITAKRLNLIGSEELTFASEVFWQVRIEIAGQIKPSNLIDLLANFDSKDRHVRIASMQFNPKAANTVNLVVDIMFKRVTNA
jgi:hypothetical protein